MIQTEIRKLVEYGLKTGLLTEEDRIYTTNRLLELFELDELAEITDEGVLAEIKETDAEDLEEILDHMLDYAFEKGIMKENGVVYRDLFDTKIMSLLMPRPSEVISRFQDYYEQDPQKATDFYYKFSCDSDYIRRYRIRKTLKSKNGKPGR